MLPAGNHAAQAFPISTEVGVAIGEAGPSGAGGSGRFGRRHLLREDRQREERQGQPEDGVVGVHAVLFYS